LKFAIGGGAPAPMPRIVQPKDFNDAWSVRLGTTWSFLDKLLEGHAGGFYETSAVPNETHSIELVDGTKFGLGCGASVNIGGVRVDLGYQHIFFPDRIIGDESIVTSGTTGASPFNPETRTRVAMGTYKASYDMVSAAVNVELDRLFGFDSRVFGKPAPSVN
jgi:long-subunit fatty acid transport protein